MKRLIKRTATTLSLMVAASVCSSGISAETLVMLDEHADNISISQSLTFNEEQFPEVNCMALNIYYETRGSSLADSFGVADVVLNRVEDTRYPNTICEVIKQGRQDSNGNMKRNQCQFSWYCDGKSDVPKDREAWKRAQSAAWEIVMWDNYRGITEGATHYHAHYVNPRWNKSRNGFSITRIGRIGVHIYYRWN